MDYTTFGQKPFGLLTVVQKTSSLKYISPIHLGNISRLWQTEIWTTGILQVDDWPADILHNKH
jgi:hypothetical protein